MEVAGLVVVVILVAVALTLLVARMRWRSATNDLIAQLSVSPIEPVSVEILPAEIDSRPSRSSVHVHPASSGTRASRSPPVWMY